LHCNKSHSCRDVRRLSSKTTPAYETIIHMVTSDQCNGRALSPFSDLFLHLVALPV
jgi:hypothetical protein